MQHLSLNPLENSIMLKNINCFGESLINHGNYLMQNSFDAKELYQICDELQEGIALLLKIAYKAEKIKEQEFLDLYRNKFSVL